MTIAEKHRWPLELARLKLRKPRFLIGKGPQLRLIGAGGAHPRSSSGSDPLHGEYIVNDAIVHATEPSDRAHAPNIRHPMHDDAIVDVDVDGLSDDDRAIGRLSVRACEHHGLAISAFERDRRERHARWRHDW